MTFVGRSALNGSEDEEVVLAAVGQVNGVHHAAVPVENGHNNGQVNDDTDSDSDSEPDVEDIAIDSKDVENGVNDNISAVKEYLDEETCMDMLRSYYGVYYDQELPGDCRCSLQGCEFDHTSNTYRIQAILSHKTADIATHYIVVKMDFMEGLPKICSIR